MNRRNLFKFLSIAPVSGAILQKPLTAEQIVKTNKINWEEEYANIFGLPMQKIKGAWTLVLDPPAEILKFGKTFTYNPEIQMYVMNE